MREESVYFKSKNSFPEHIESRFTSPECFDFDDWNSAMRIVLRNGAGNLHLELCL